jgi:hypothetical protein
MLIASMMVVETHLTSKVQQGAILRQSYITAQFRTGHAGKAVGLAMGSISTDRVTHPQLLGGAIAMSVQRDRVHLGHTVAMGGEEVLETGQQPVSLASMGPSPQRRQPLVRAFQDTLSWTTNLPADPVLIPKRTRVSPFPRELVVRAPSLQTSKECFV